MKNRNIHRLFYKLRHRYLSLNNIVVGVALIIALSWVWGSLGMLQRNYDLQTKLNHKQQELKLAKLETTSLKLEQDYYKTREFQELAVRDYLGIAKPGEHVLVVAKRQTNPSFNPKQTIESLPSQTNQQPSNFEQWINFLFNS